jgi:anti-sigma regulatory factor (Ser/Thr protein kinase)
VSSVLPAPPSWQGLADLRPRLIRRLDQDSQWPARDTTRAWLLREAGAHSLVVLPLAVGGVVLGVVGLYRRADSAPFEEDDLREAGRLADHAALCLDTVSRHPKEGDPARPPQRSLLPEELPTLSALEAAEGHLPAEDCAGQWFDVLPLSSARVALVVGVAEGRGVHAAVRMTQLRAAITALAALDVSPDRLLAHLDDVLIRLARQHPALRGRSRNQEQTGTNCLYVVYDPVTGHGTAARAGSPSLVIAHPDGTTSAPRLATRSPVGTDGDANGRPFESTGFDIPAGSTLLLYSGSSDASQGAPGPAAERLRGALTRTGPDLPRLLEHVTRDVLPGRESVLLLARTRRLEVQDVATRTLPQDPAAVAVARAWASRQLTTWTLDELADTTTLVVSELVTNAIRYSDGPIELRLIHDDRTLICEVTDTNGAGAHRLEPQVNDEGGRGLSIVAQLTQRQGTRYTISGKTIWTEQCIAS